jgi:hypothetical protein
MGIIDQVISTLESESSGPVFDEAIRNAAFLFEKAEGLQPAGWSDEIIKANVTCEDLARLKFTLAKLIERGGRGVWALSKSCDPKVKATCLRVLRRELNGDAGELYQAIVALQNIGECLGKVGSSQGLIDVAENRESARKYLESLD